MKNSTNSKLGDYELGEDLSDKALKTFWEDFTLEEDAWLPFKKFKYLVKNDIPIHSYLEDRKTKEMEQESNE